MNKYRRHAGTEIQPVQKNRLKITELAIGAQYQKSARLIPLGASPELGHVRFESEAIRKDFGSSAVGLAAGAKIIGIGEHKFILNDQSYHRLIRLYMDGGDLALDVWSGSAWVRTDTYTGAAGIAEVYLDLATTQNRFLIADGKQIITWYEAATEQTVEDDFPSGNSLTGPDDVTSVTLSSEANDDEYNIRYYVDLVITNGSDYDITIGFYRDTGSGYVQHTTKLYELASGTNTWTDELLTMVHDMGSSGKIQIKIESVVPGTWPTQTATWGSGSTYTYEATKGSAEEAWDDNYVYNFSVVGTSGTVQVEFLYDSGSGWTSLGTKQYTTNGAKQETYNLDGMGNGDKFAMDVTTLSGDRDVSITTEKVEWESVIESTDYTLDVHGYNKATDLDTYAGVTYTENVPPSSTMELLAAAAPKARFILPFGDRLLAYRDGGDLQHAAWSADGDITDWSTGDSGSTTLLDVRSDGIDAIMGAAVLTSSIVAVFRQRSIMRAQETGNVNLAMGHFHWIENLGTESPFSIQATPYGILFLGHDLQVYMLTQSGPQPVGVPIHRWLIEHLTSNLELVDSAYDSVFGEYYLGVPEDNATKVTKLWILDLGALVEEQRTVWRPRAINIERLGMASEIE